LADRDPGSQLAKRQKEAAYQRTMEHTGDILCVPWTGIDVRGSTMCPGFDYLPDRGLVAYVIPLSVIRSEGLMPGIDPTRPFAEEQEVAKQEQDDIDAAQTEGSGDRAELSERQSNAADAEKKAKLEGKRTQRRKYMEIIQKYLRMIKIAIPLEAHEGFFPNNNDYHILVNGPYQRALYGHLVARVDSTGDRFRKIGVGFEKLAIARSKRTAATVTPKPSRVNSSDNAGSSPSPVGPVLGDASVTTSSPAPSAATKAGVSAMAEEFKAGNSPPVSGAPKRGTPAQKATVCTD